MMMDTNYLYEYEDVIIVYRSGGTIGPHSQFSHDSFG